MAVICFYLRDNCDFKAKVYKKGKSETMLKGGSDGYSNLVCSSCLKEIKIQLCEGEDECPKCHSKELIGHNVDKCPKCKIGNLVDDPHNNIYF